MKWETRIKQSAEEFYRQFTAPEERKPRHLEWSGGHRWFASANVTKLEDHLPAGEMPRILARLRQRRQEAAGEAIRRMLRKGQ